MIMVDTRQFELSSESLVNSLTHSMTQERTEYTVKALCTIHMQKCYAAACYSNSSVLEGKAAWCVGDHTHK